MIIRDCEGDMFSRSIRMIDSQAKRKRSGDMKSGNGTSDGRLTETETEGERRRGERRDVDSSGYDQRSQTAGKLRETEGEREAGENEMKERGKA